MPKIPGTTYKAERNDKVVPLSAAITTDFDIESCGDLQLARRFKRVNTAFREQFGFTPENTEFDGVDMNVKRASKAFLTELRDHQVACLVTLECAIAAGEVCDELQFFDEYEDGISAEVMDSVYSIHGRRQRNHIRAVDNFTTWMETQMDVFSKEAL